MQDNIPNNKHGRIILSKEHNFQYGLSMRRINEYEHMFTTSMVVYNIILVTPLILYILFNMLTSYDSSSLFDFLGMVHNIMCFLNIITIWLLISIELVYYIYVKINIINVIVVFLVYQISIIVN